MKKKLILLCVLALLVAGLAVNAHADGAPTLTVSSTSVNIGGTVDVTVTLSNNPGVTGFGYALEYDKTVFTFSKSTRGTIANAFRDFDAGQALINADGGAFATGSAETMSDNGLLCTYTFNVSSTATSGNYTFKVKPTATAEGVIFAGQGTNHVCVDGTITVNAAPHTCAATGSNIHAAVPKTCTTPGNSAYYVCDTCGKFYSDSACTKEIAENSWVIAASHNLSSVPEVKGADCTTNGTAAHKSCADCGKKFTTSSTNTNATEYDPAGKGPAGDHDWNADSTATPKAGQAPTCLAAGKGEVTCKKNATHKKEVNMAKLEHSMTKVDGTAATCAEDGVKDTWTCSAGCGKTYLDEAGATEATAANKVIDKSTVAHTKVEKQAYKAATASEDGTLEVFECSVCHDWYKGDTANSGAYTKLSDAEKAKAEADDFSDFVIAKGSSSSGTGTGTDSNKPGSGKPGDKNAPKTGDETNIALWVVLFALCATVVTVIATKKLRKN